MNDKITLHKNTNLFGVDLKAGEYVRKKEWVGLTDEEIKDIVWNMPYEPGQDEIRAIEAKLKEKNT